MKVLTKLAFIISVLILPTFCFCEPDNNEENCIINFIDRENYLVQIKQYNKDYPIVLYVIFKESTPLLNEIRKILRTELLVFAKKELEPTLKANLKTKKKSKDNNKDKQKETETGLKTIKKVVIASAWFNDQVSENLEKIELTKRYGSFVWLYDETDKDKIFTFEEYLKYLKKKKEDSKKKERTENSKDIKDIQK